MNKEYLKDKILGCLSMAAVGDALGMPTHDMTIDEIARRFKGPVIDFHPPFSDTRVHPRHGAAEITDDTLLTLALARSYIETRGRIDSLTVARHTAEAFNKAKAIGRDRMFGPSTRKGLEALEEGMDPVEAALAEKHPMTGASNGGAMKIAPAGLVHPGDPAAAVEDAVIVCLPSHATTTGISAAAAIAAGVAEGVSSRADVYSVVQACLAGALLGERLASEKARVTPLPSVPERIKLAVELVLKAGDPVEANRKLADVIGTGLAAYESIPTAVGIFLANGGDPEKCVQAGANVGFDTDTIASMAGALAGALRGFEATPKRYWDRVASTNNLDLDVMADELADIAITKG